MRVTSSSIALMHVKGHAAADTKAAVEQARLRIEQAEASFWRVTAPRPG
jgi:hypothetical protein